VLTLGFRIFVRLHQYSGQYSGVAGCGTSRAKAVVWSAIWPAYIPAYLSGL
jgi:hypothetical protein